MTATIINFAEARAQLRIAEVLTLTTEAYSRSAYGEVEWAKCAAILLDVGHSVSVAADLLMSRLTRFARDDEEATAEGFARFLSSPTGLSTIRHELAA